MHRFARLLIASAALAAAPAIAETRHFIGREDGISFDYTVETRPNQDLVLHGVYPDSGETFRLTVDRRGYVEGRVGSQAVSFLAGKAARDRLTAQLDSTDTLIASRR